LRLGVDVDQCGKIVRKTGRPPYHVAVDIAESGMSAMPTLTIEVNQCSNSLFES
jgi:hypothetical protein